MSDFMFMSPAFADLYVISGKCIDMEGMYVCAERIADKKPENIFYEDIPDKNAGYIPFGADLRWWFAEQYHAGTLDDAVKDLDFRCVYVPKRPVSESKRVYNVEFDKDSGICFEEYWEGEPVKYVNGGYPGQIRTTKVITPVGSLVSKEKYISFTFGIIEYLIKTEADLDIFRYILEHTKIIPVPDPDPFCNNWFSSGPKTSMQAFIVELAGVFTTAFLMADCRQKMEEILSMMSDIEDKIYQLFAESPVHGVFICENLSSDVSAGYWDEYIGPQLAKWAGMLHARGKKIGIHLDGTLNPLLGRLKEAGIDSVNGLTAAPSGDMEFERMREVAGDDIVIESILPQIIFTPAYSEEEFEQYVKSAILHFKDDYKVALGIGDLLPVDGLIKRVEKVVKMIWKLGAREKR
ncbi:MAG: hypothetical protein FWD23_03640 [Oscillospiraceae bacterium]|nr:hypothetical protein [Oscillospiraceae bacterium]